MAVSVNASIAYFISEVRRPKILAPFPPDSRLGYRIPLSVALRVFGYEVRVPMCINN